MPDLRKFLCEKRKQLSAEQLRRASRLISGKLSSLGLLRQGMKAGCFFATAGEASADEFVANHAAKFFFPVIQNMSDATMGFYPWRAGEPLLVNGYGIQEPVPNNRDPVDPGLFDAVLMPMVAFDAAGNRLGMGAGFYDRCFSFKAGKPGKAPLLIGLAHGFQRQNELVPESWDIPLDIIVTPEQVFKPGMSAV